MGDIFTCRLLIDSGEAAGSIVAGKISHELRASLGLPLPPTPGLLVGRRGGLRLAGTKARNRQIEPGVLGLSLVAARNHSLLEGSESLRRSPGHTQGTHAFICVLLQYACLCLLMHARQISMCLRDRSEAPV